MSQWAQRPAMDRFWDLQDASNKNYIINIFIYIILSLSSNNLPIRPCKKTSYFWALCPLIHLFYSFRTTTSRSFRQFDGRQFPIYFVRGPFFSYLFFTLYNYTTLKVESQITIHSLNVLLYLLFVKGLSLSITRKSCFDFHYLLHILKL